MNLPLWLEDETYPAYLRKAAREAGEEVLGLESLSEELREDVAGARTVLLLWAWQYYNGEPSVSDEVFDALVRYLKIREARHPELVTPLSPTQRVGKVMPA
jgi:DNA ligase (NAD+)